ncbi:MAG: LytTR family transcriptional regulator DNA-binding domain-containing protein [Bacteroidia bacterium]|nr:LytTR family transcriptional regulator DNA-binding domain-containing protein [Bacteroidia bacterium]
MASNSLFRDDLRIMNLQNLLKTPFPRPRWNKKNLLWLSLIGMSCSLFIILFKPFGIENVNKQWYYDLVILSMGILFIGSYLFIEGLIPKLFPGLYKNWSLWKAILWYSLVMLFTGGVLFLYKSFLAGFSDFTLSEYFFVIGRTALIILTVSFFSLGLYQYFNRKTLSVLSSSEAYVLTSSLGKSLNIYPKDILYISSDDNYVDIHYLQDGLRKKEVLRASLKNVEAQVVNVMNPIYRCHRSYLINADQVEIQNSSSRNMRLSLKGYEDEIPVSRQYVDRIKKVLSTDP